MLYLAQDGSEKALISLADLSGVPCNITHDIIQHKRLFCPISVSESNRQVLSRRICLSVLAGTAPARSLCNVAGQVGMLGWSLLGKR
jgi:hypothetical protein